MSTEGTAERHPGMMLATLTERYGLSAGASAKLVALAEILAADAEAPTAVREPARVRDDHLADSLVALELPVVQEARTLVDIGSGAGVPGLPLAIALPSCHVCLLESNGRKCRFMARAADACGIQNVEIVNARAEGWEDGAGRSDLVTARAVAPLDVVAEYAAPLLRIGGTLVAWRGKPEPEVEADARRAAEKLGLCVEDPVHVRPYPAAEHRYLYLMSKVRPTPSGFPRRPGMARKRPLGRLAKRPGSSDRGHR